MNPIARALWYIEMHANAPFRVEDVTDVSGISRTHLMRLFPLVTGQPVGSYVRSRRLSEAARQLAAGAPDILEVALDAGYSSHEAFTRAFRDRFGVTPESVRAGRSTDALELQEPLTMDELSSNGLAEPRFVEAEPMTIAGISDRFPCNDPRGIPTLWQKFGPHIGNIDGAVTNDAFGVVFDMPEDGETMQYIAGLEVKPTADLPREFAAIRFPAQTYAVFSSAEHISTIRPTIGASFEWLSKHGYKTGELPVMLERYPEAFDPVTGNGGYEVWFPIRR